MEQKAKDAIAAELAAEYRSTIRRSATEAKEPRSRDYTADGRSMSVAYLLWFLLGYFGAHRFYLGRYRSGCFMAMLSFLGMILAFVLVGFVFLIPVSIWWIADAFLIPGMMANRPAS
jgi:TM2 domain-containing membrane protein YozV